MQNGHDFSILRRLRKAANLTLNELAEKSGVSYAVISRLERNQANPSLDAIANLSAVFNLTSSELIAMSEPERPALYTAGSYRNRGFQFQRTELDQMVILHGRAAKGEKLHNPEKNSDDIEYLTVLDGRLKLILNDKEFELEPGHTIRFGAFFDHTYEAMTDITLQIIHFPKGQRWQRQYQQQS